MKHLTIEDFQKKLEDKFLEENLEALSYIDI